MIKKTDPEQGIFSSFSEEYVLGNRISENSFRKPGLIPLPVKAESGAEAVFVFQNAVINYLIAVNEGMNNGI